MSRTQIAGLRPRGVAAAQPFEVVPDGIWTWFTMPEAVQVGDHVYAGTVSSDGRCRAHRINLLTQSAETFDLSGVLEVDDHNNASVLPRPDGTVAFFYGKHNDTLLRYRVWDGAGGFTSSVSWSAEVQHGSGQGPHSYPKPFVFPSDTTAGRVWLFYRRWLDSETRSIAFRTADDVSGDGDSWSAYTDVLSDSNTYPYVIMFRDGDTLHCAVSNHPTLATYTTVRHCKGTMTGGALVWSDSDGSTLTPLFGIAGATRADDGGDAKRWVSDIAVGADGHPRILWTKYVGAESGEIELWHSRWTGTAWVAHKVADDGVGLYPAERYYHGGARFKWSDVTRVFASLPISGVRQVLELSTSDNGATWAQLRALTSGGSAGAPLKARPVAVHNSDGRVNVLWWQGTYTTYIDYSTSVQAAG